MTKPKHTPGPWAIHKNPFKNSGGFDCIDPIGILIDTPYIEKNAHLIAAAPELLEALKTAHRVLLLANKLQTAHEIEQVILKATGISE